MHLAFTEHLLSPWHSSMSARK